MSPLCLPVQVTCGTDRESPPATLRAPPGSSSPATPPRCLWDRWTRSDHSRQKSSGFLVNASDGSMVKMINDATAPPPPQVWVIADGVPGFPTETPGAVCHRLGVGPMKPKGQSWDYGIGVCLELHSTTLWSQNSELQMTSHSIRILVIIWKSKIDTSLLLASLAHIHNIVCT